MQTAILTLHVIVCLVLVILVLLQAGREGMGVIFGGSGNSSVFGSSGAGGVLVKLTAFMAVLFICTSLGYNILTSSRRDEGSSFLDVQFEESVPPVQTPAPVEEPEQAASEAIPADNVQPVEDEAAPADSTDETAPESAGTENVPAENSEASQQEAQQ